MQTTATVRRRPPTAFAALALLAALGSMGPPSASAQSVLDRPPNMDGTWVGRTGTLYFNFIHRFTDTGEPLRKIINYPTFLLATGVADEALVGIRYGSNSELVSGIPNEWEAFARYAPLGEDAGQPFDLALHAGYNHAAESFDGAVTVARTFGDRFRTMAGARGFSDAFATGESRWAWSVGGTLQLTNHMALAGDYTALFDLDGDAEEAAWSAGLQLGIPYTPHTFSLQASNATTTTLQGSAVGSPDTRYGFEFTVPITLSRYFGGDAGQPSPAPRQAGERLAAEVGMTNRLAFTPDTVRIRVGETVRWTNNSDLLHTVTLDPTRAVNASNVKMPQGASTFDSGNMEPGATFQYTFTVAGEYQYVCVPHEMAGMIGVVIVQE